MTGETTPDLRTSNLREQTQDGQAGPPPPPRARRRRRGRRPLLAAAALIAAGGVAAAVTLSLRDGTATGTVASDLPPATAKVSKQTLKDTVTADGQLGFGPSSTATSRLPGTITRLPDTGDTESRGRELYEVDGKPVTLMYGGKPAYRDMGPGDEGKDVEQLEKNLSELGYGGFTVDDEYTSATAGAVTEWQDDRGLKETGTVRFGQVVFAAGEVRVDTHHVGEGDPIAPGGKVLSYTGTDKAVTVELEAADQRMARQDAEVEVTLPDDTTVTGTIDSVATVIEPAASQSEEPTTKVEVVIWLKGDNAGRAAEDYALAAVDVTFVAGERKDVLTVPVAALVALAEGGFGLEAVQGSATRYVPVDTGLFADGRVEVSGGGVRAGMTVGIPE